MRRGWWGEREAAHSTALRRAPCAPVGQCGARARRACAAVPRWVRVEGDERGVGEADVSKLLVRCPRAWRAWCRRGAGIGRASWWCIMCVACVVRVCCAAELPVGRTAHAPKRDGSRSRTRAAFSAYAGQASTWSLGPSLNQPHVSIAAWFIACVLETAALRCGGCGPT